MGKTLKKMEQTMVQHDRNIPKKVEKTQQKYLLLKKGIEKYWARLTNSTPYKTTFKPQVLFLRSNNGIRILEGIKPGLYKTKNSEGKDVTINLSANKLQTLYYGDQLIQCWIANKDDFDTFPQNVEHSARATHQVIQAISLNYKELDTTYNKERTKMYMMIGLIFILGLFALQSTGMLDSIVAAMRQQSTSTAINTAVEVAKNTSKVTIT